MELGSSTSLHPWLRLPLLRVVVEDTSMAPTLRPGDHLIVNRWSRPRPGDLIVAKDPEYTKRLLVKRLVERMPDGAYVVSSENPRSYGAIASGSIRPDKMQGLAELVLAIVALTFGVIAFALVNDVRGRVASLEAAQQTRRQMDADAQAAHEAVHYELGELRRDLETTRRELSELKAAAEIVPAPPLPKGRGAGLDDLREQLRASHLDPESSSEDL
jgi:hypothetical protein